LGLRRGGWLVGLISDPGAAPVEPIKQNGRERSFRSLKFAVILAGSALLKY
jgi:hypothetical protein